MALTTPPPSLVSTTDFTALARRPGDALRVLHLVESDADASLVAEHLARSGLDCDLRRAVARDDYLCALAVGTYDLILADFVPSDFDGLVALQEARRAQPDVPFIFVAGPSNDECSLNSLRLGATDFVRKNCLDRLGPAVCRALREADDRVAHRAVRADLALLVRASEVLGSSLDHETTLRHVVGLVLPRLGDFGFLDVREEDGGVRRIAQGVDPSTSAVLERSRWHPVAGQHAGYCALLSSLPAIFPDVTPEWLADLAVSPEHLAELRVLAPISMLTVPLQARGVTQGALSLFFSTSGRRHSLDDLALAGEIARRAAVAVENARLFRAARRAEDVARRESSRLRVALDAGRMGAWEWVVATGRVHWSEQVEAMYGVARGGFGGTLADYSARLHPDDRADVLAAIERSVTDGTELHVEHRIVWLDGTIRWIEGRGALLCDRAGAPERMLGVCVDVTSRKETELRLREREASLQFLSEASAALVGSFDDRSMLATVTSLAVPAIADCALVDLAEPDGTIRRVAVAHRDPAMADLAWELGRRFPPSAAEPSVIGRTLRTGAAAWVEEITPEFLATVVPDEEQRTLLLRGGLRSFLCVPLLTRSRVVGVFTLASGGCGRRYAEPDVALAMEVARRIGVALENVELYREAREASRMKDEFLATMSHELRTPMTAILGWSALLPARLGDPEALRHGLKVIERNARAQARLIDDVLDVSRIVTGKLRLETVPVDLGAVVRAALDVVEGWAQGRSIRLAVHLADDLGVIVGDPDRLQQVVWNLCQNAVKFTPIGGVVSVSAARDGAVVRLRVTDTGQGIGAEFLPHVFERFRQADSSSTRAHGGLGLGLAITQHLVELHGGSVLAESPGEGRGATFTVTLPTGVEASPRVGVLRASTVVPPPRRGVLAGLRVLVCDDEADGREILVEIMRRDGATVESVGSAAEAIRCFDVQPPDVLVTDIGMPDEDGYELIRRVRARAPAAGGRTPAVALTAYAQAEDARRALAAGFQRHVSKPVAAERLIAVVASVGGLSRGE